MKQQIKAMLDDERGVSPVIGVILMVAITVILAAVIGTFVLGLGDSLEQAPQSQVSVEDSSASQPYTEGNAAIDLLEISHRGGDTIAASEYQINIENPDGDSLTIYDGGTQSDTYTNDLAGQGSDETVTVEFASDPSDFSVGDTATVQLSSDVVDDGTGETDEEYNFSGEWEIQIIHIPSDSILKDVTITVN